uniref:Cytochrome b n=2 Tax=Cylindrus obtusus TaxID=649475 RepID=I1T1X2_9EUPU|nr:cytochrome b [Cylindrus obtusus]AEK48352.1 cytochrome b [Cylindrus obtusus]
MKKIREVEALLSLPSPVNISNWWNIGSVLGFLLVFQLATGFLLSLHYTADMTNTFNSIVHLMRDVPGGWVFRAAHANGASMFFFLIYLHIGRGLYYQSYALQSRAWLVGATIFLLSMGTAFLGYVLPWGQMSYWGATVITNLLSAVPYLGDTLVMWVWGGFAVGQATLNRFFSLHFLLPFVISVFVLLHLLALHVKGSSNPLGNLFHLTKVPFHPYFTWKDVVGVLVMLNVLFLVVFFAPQLFTDPENFMEANPMVTPTHIQPEWYFLFAYAILRSIPSKMGGVIALAASVLCLYVFPLAAQAKLCPTPYFKVAQWVFWSYVVIFLLLTWLGACPVEEPFITLSQPLTCCFFAVPVLFFSLAMIYNKLLLFLSSL